MIRVALIGSGNVAQHLAQAFTKSPDVNLVQVFERTPGQWAGLRNIPVTAKLSDLIDADLYVIAISDQAIVPVSYDLPFEEKLIVHTSGSIPMNAMDPKNRRGVFYPLQTFSKSNRPDFSTIPLCIEAESGNDLELIRMLAHSISGTVIEIDTAQRKALHISAVFANNFVNHLYKIGSDICSSNDIPFDILKPLIRETAEKVMSLSPDDAQTGPAMRQDAATIAAHIDFLRDENQRNIYTLLTQSIMSHGKL